MLEDVYVSSLWFAYQVLQAQYLNGDITDEEYDMQSLPYLASIEMHHRAF